MKFLFLKKINKKAFSLIELSIVIVIISILLSGALSIVTSTTNSSKIKATNNNINEVYNAIKVYLLTNNRLPCPAPITAIKSTSDSYGTTTGTAGNCYVAGVYTSNTNDNLVYGMVPVKDLGLSADMAEDAFGNKLAYIVDKRFTAGGIADNTFGGDNAGLITIKETTSAMVGGAKVNQTNTSSAIFVIISYGSNKLGAFGINSATQNAKLAAVDEFESNNYPDIEASIQDTFYSHSGNSDVFDDMVFYKTRDMLVTEAGAFNLIPCPALPESSSGVSYVGDNGVTYNMTWSKATYGQIAAADTNCPSGYLQTVAKPTKKCNALGNWQVGVIDPCTYTATAAASALSCIGTGGTSTTSGSKTVHKFTTVGSNSSLACTGSGTITYLVVGGGGGGGGVDTDLDGGGGGGGGGGVKTGTYVVSDQTITITVTVGAGGVGGVSSVSPTNNITSTGGTSSLGAIASATGGVGGNYGGGGAGGNSGGGDITAKTGGLSGICPGGSGGGSTHGGGGGGASMASSGTAGTRSTNPSHGGGAGAGGTSNSITGSSIMYGGGGGGGAGGGNSEGSSSTSPVQGGGAAGSGGGGIGNRNDINNPGIGTNSLGGGGGGGGKFDNGAAGGSGVVIVSYPTPPTP